MSTFEGECVHIVLSTVIWLIIDRIHDETRILPRAKISANVSNLYNDTLRATQAMTSLPITTTLLITNFRTPNNIRSN